MITYEVPFLTDELRHFLQSVKGRTVSDALNTLRETSPEVLCQLAGLTEVDPCGVYDDVAMELDSYADLYGNDSLIADLLNPKDKLLDKVERAANIWPSFKYGALTPTQRRVLGWLAFGQAKPPRVNPKTVRSLIDRGIIERTDEGLKVTEKGQEYVRTIRKC